MRVDAHIWRRSRCSVVDEEGVPGSASPSMLIMLLALLRVLFCIFPRTGKAANVRTDDYYRRRYMYYSPPRCARIYTVCCCANGGGLICQNLFAAAYSWHEGVITDYRGGEVSE